MTQSAVCKQIKSPEDALGTALFLRSGKGLSLTRQGREVYAKARVSLAQLASAGTACWRSTGDQWRSPPRPPSPRFGWHPNSRAFQLLKPAMNVLYHRHASLHKALPTFATKPLL
ncbi:LysR family transcriptional regulator [Polaromonas eurypsychrophila]|uniref:LysR family transcriptional regulator n=1 Tax=Polaromonas eurypsychrophila TaxID=1614635 RepID=UPI0027E5153B|nr:LysR family transcriptional regulator [Polaromonas eurypsychrophila]